MPADHVPGALVLESAQVGPGAVGQRQIRDVGDPHPVGLDGLGLVQPPVGGAAQAVGGVGGAGGWGRGLREPARKAGAGAGFF